MKKVMRLFFAAAVLVGLASCNSNDDFGSQAIEIPGITIDGCGCFQMSRVSKLLVQAP